VLDLTASRSEVLLGIAFSALLAVVAIQPDVSRHNVEAAVAVEAPVALETQDATPRAGDLVVARKSAGAGRVVGRVTPELDASYDHSTAPSAVIAGAEMSVEIRLTNTGARLWPAGGDQPVRLGYHWYDASGNTLLSDGATAALSGDVASGEATTLNVSVRAPQADGTYTLAWDLAQAGTGWFSGNAVAMKTESIVVGDGVTFYGKGWGHGVGLSQWGAQGWAEGAVGPRLSGEEILAKYFAGADIVTPPDAPPFRVLLSAPSSGCVGRTIGDVASLNSEGGMRLVNDADPTVVYAQTGPGQSLRASRSGADVVVTDRVAPHRLRGSRCRPRRAGAALGPDQHRRKGALVSRGSLASGGGWDVDGGQRRLLGRLHARRAARRDAAVLGDRGAARAGRDRTDLRGVEEVERGRARVGRP
jgi:hypothetical protein